MEVPIPGVLFVVADKMDPSLKNRFLSRQSRNGRPGFRAYSEEQGLGEDPV